MPNYINFKLEFVYGDRQRCIAIHGIATNRLNLSHHSCFLSKLIISLSILNCFDSLTSLPKCLARLLDIVSQKTKRHGVLTVDSKYYNRMKMLQASISCVHPQKLKVSAVHQNILLCFKDVRVYHINA